MASDATGQALFTAKLPGSMCAVLMGQLIEVRVGASQIAPSCESCMYVHCPSVSCSRGSVVVSPRTLCSRVVRGEPGERDRGKSLDRFRLLALVHVDAFELCSFFHDLNDLVFYFQLPDSLVVRTSGVASMNSSRSLVFDSINCN